MDPEKQSSGEAVSKVGTRQKRPKTGGRKKGTPNKATAAKAEAIAKSGQTPLDFMLSVMRNAKNPQDIRLDAAKSAAPYVHPKLAAIEHTGKEGAPLIPTERPSDDKFARMILLLLEKGAAAAEAA